MKKRAALLAHPASIDSRFVHRIEWARKRYDLVKLFGPEHGIHGTAQDMDSVESSADPLTGLPVKSLYGATFDSLKPTQEDLRGIDVFICDLQDIGSRYYTFIYTMAFCMKACAESGIKMIVIDRPNPINGLHVEGPLLQKGFESFVGLYPLPVRHGMTIGELALYFNQEEKIGCELEIVRMKKWRRKMFFDETGLPWVPPSPNMPTPDTALVYPGMCLLEATQMSEGRGTTRPFEFFGAPYIQAEKLAVSLNKLKLPGVFFRPLHFRPNFQKWAGQNCQGAQIHVTDRKKFRPYLMGVSVLKTVMEMYPDDFQWRDKPYEFVSDIPAIDLLTGSDEFRKGITKTRAKGPLRGEAPPALPVEGGDASPLVIDEMEFLKKRKKYLLY
ncbi:MAG: DUF1343 domain-containing protein [Deltaproteobacteria bacterium]|nr:DUF1343 domain-containing protein [Deltaproteobacteria bacterium]